MGITHDLEFPSKTIPWIIHLKETWVQSLGWEDPLEKGKATHSSILAWRIPSTTVYGVAKSHTWLSNFHFHFFPINSEAAMNQRKQNTGIWLWPVQELIIRSIALHKLCVLGSVYLLESHVKSHDQTKCAWSEILAILITKDMLWYILFIRNTLLCFTCIFPGKRNET